ncbi:hypothetical protein JCGZ_05881 [Jatropha curcas]|uniref:Uncharacterized protein n=1 Tax=Jatropha curcas TaxID=180498 RepID=A0A067J8R6_JATCU|nr:uncharacterized protein LOC105650670 [Jatropha curcas]KDP20112.1 hypothetical protein JCGZ_05881 [Jatropha curcas]
MDGKGKEKRRRIDKESDEAKSKKVRHGDNKEEATDEEVEEFFAILRSMQVAVKYFEKGKREGWRAAVEAEVVAVVGGSKEDEDDDHQIKKKKGSPAKINPIVEEEEMAVLDLNALPAVESSEICITESHD